MYSFTVSEVNQKERKKIKEKKYSSIHGISLNFLVFWLRLVPIFRFTFAIRFIPSLKCIVDYFSFGYQPFDYILNIGDSNIALLESYFPSDCVELFAHFFYLFFFFCFCQWIFHKWNHLKYFSKCSVSYVASNKWLDWIWNWCTYTV